MTPAQFLEAFVEPNQMDCYERPGDVRRAFNAAVSASHLADHYFAYNKRHHPERVRSFKKLGDLVEYLASRTQGAFRDIRSISNAYKHLYTGTGSFGQFSNVDSCGSIESMTFPEMEEISGMEEEYISPENGEPRSAVIVKRKDGSKAEFQQLLNQVVECLIDLVHADA